MEGFTLGNQQYHLDRVHRSTDPSMKAIERLIDQAFPSNEIIPFSKIRHRVETGLQVVFSCRRDAEVIAFALFANFSQSHFLLLDYFAVAPAARGQGIGSHLLKLAIASLRRDHPDCPILAEVEDPSEGDSLARKLKRVRFYQRLGMQFITNFSYLLPPLNHEGDVPIDLTQKATFEPLKFLVDLPEKGNTLTSSTLRAILELLLSHHYGFNNASDVIDHLLVQFPEILYFDS